MDNEIPLKDKRVSILFVCHGNTCRSLMAEALARRLLGDTAQVASAGLHAGAVADTANAIFTLKAYYDLDASGHVPRSINTVDIDPFDFIVALDKHIAKELTGVPKQKLFVWNIPDPYGDDLTEYRSCAFKITRELSKFVSKLK